MATRFLGQTLLLTHIPKVLLFHVFFVTDTGGRGNSQVAPAKTYEAPQRPCFIIPSDAKIDEFGNIVPPPVTIAETWLINAALGPLSDKTFDVNFVSNDTEYSQFWIGLRMGDYQIRYDDTLVFDADGIGWKNQAYRTIGLYEPASGDFLTWLNANAVKQS